MREAIKQSGTETQMNQFNKIYEDLKTLDLLNNDVCFEKFILEHLINYFNKFHCFVQQTLDERLCATFPPMLPKNLFLKMKQKTTKFN